MTIPAKRQPKPLPIHAVCSVVPDMSGDEYLELRGSIKQRGQLEPIWLSADGRIIDGRHRYQACRELGVEPAFVRTKLKEDAEIANTVVALNLHRRHLSESQMAMVSGRLRALYVEDAKERARVGREKGAAAPKRKRKSGESLSEDLRTSSAVTTPGDLGAVRKKAKSAAAEAAAKVGVNPRMTEHGVRVLEQGVPELAAAVDKGIIPVTAASSLCKALPETQRAVVEAVKAGTAKNVRQALRQRSLAEQLAAIAVQPVVAGQYDVVVVDPPWTFAKTREDDETQRGRTPYPTMSEDEIKAIKIPAKENAVLWLWTTNAHLVSGEALRVVEAWGFTPKTLLTWAKPKLGVGDWLRGQTEHCILARRGIPVMRPPVPSTLLAAPVGEHSEKPDAFYALVRQFCTGSCCELFARKVREGWAQHGADLGSVSTTGGVAVPLPDQSWQAVPAGGVS